ncbi:MAG: peptidoglycan-binding protein [Proteobacteria bacterium]|nr:peptidoglycan-binding protein [Pseudomonadota bacterium]
MPVYAHRTDQASQQSSQVDASQGLADFGSNVERTDEVEKQSVQPTWFEEVMSLVSKTTDDVYAEAGQEAAEAVNAEVEQPGAAEAQPAWATEEDDATYAPKGKMGRVHAKHTERLADGIELDLGMREKDLEIFVAHYAKHRARYEGVSAKTNIPAKLIAALHWRESTGNFNTYLHQGDPIGKPSRNVPRGVLFYDWETAAIDALSAKSGIRDNVGMTAETTDTAAIASFSEAYNGLGYHNKGRPSPYVYAGTAEYQSGKYVRDGVYSSRAVDQQLGVLPMVGALGGLETPITEADRETEWAKVLAGSTLLRKGSRGLAVEALQERLGKAGFDTAIDGSFGPATRRMVMEWQRSEGLVVDGVVGKNTSAVLG